MQFLPASGVAFDRALDDQLDKGVQSPHDVEDELAEGHYEEFPKNPLISAPSGMCKAISLTIVHTVIHVTYKGDILLIRVKYSP